MIRLPKNSGARAARYEYGDDFIVGIHELKRAYVTSSCAAHPFALFAGCHQVQMEILFSMEVFSRMMKRSALADYVQVRVAASGYTSRCLAAPMPAWPPRMLQFLVRRLRITDCGETCPI